ncbi:hypothetical protein A2U01_0052539, partial [Trifolium medium]|nr:hypothetical protein [Trifolium medium]
MSKAPMDPRDNYIPQKITDKTLALGSPDKTLALGSPSYLNKIMASPQSIISTRIRPQTGIRPCL